MPATIGMYLIETGDEVELLAQVAKGEGGQLRPGRPGQAHTTAGGTHRQPVFLGQITNSLALLWRP